MTYVRDIKITINGVELNEAQVMTMCVAVDALYADLECEPNKLGGDNLAEMIADGYRKNLREIIIAMNAVK